MSRYIDADAVIGRLAEAMAYETEMETGEFIDCVEDAEELLNGIPTIDIEPKRGEWIAKTENCHSHWVCSECGAWALLEYNEQMCLSNFCPNCGAEMRKEGE